MHIMSSFRQRLKSAATELRVTEHDEAQKMQIRKTKSDSAVNYRQRGVGDAHAIQENYRTKYYVPEPPNKAADSVLPDRQPPCQ